MTDSKNKWKNDSSADYAENSESAESADCELIFFPRCCIDVQAIVGKVTLISWCSRPSIPRYLSLRKPSPPKKKHNEDPPKHLLETNQNYVMWQAMSLLNSWGAHR